jgi:hypothetical protein
VEHRTWAGRILTCTVPVGIINAVEGEAKLALPKDVGIK